jgi:hypothetical protein
MSAAFAGAQVIELAASPAMRLRAPRPAAAAGDESPRTSPVSVARVADRVARRKARVLSAASGVRVARFRALLPLFRLWRRWRRGLPLSCLWCAPATLSTPPSSPGGAVRQPKRFPRPVGAHQRRDLSAIANRRASRGRAPAQ